MITGFVVQDMTFGHTCIGTMADHYFLVLSCPQQSIHSMQPLHFLQPPLSDTSAQNMTGNSLLVYIIAFMEIQGFSNMTGNSCHR
jgi:hypothetical protein